MTPNQRAIILWLLALAISKLTLYGERDDHVLKIGDKPLPLRRLAFVRSSVRFADVVDDEPVFRGVVLLRVPVPHDLTPQVPGHFGSGIALHVALEDEAACADLDRLIFVLAVEGNRFWK